jgi:hypothetical protein
MGARIYPFFILEHGHGKGQAGLFTTFPAVGTIQQLIYFHGVIDVRHINHRLFFGCSGGNRIVLAYLHIGQRVNMDGGYFRPLIK